MQRMRDADIEIAAAYFASAGSQWPAKRPLSLLMLPFTYGKELRHYWKKARSAVQQLVPAEAFTAMDKEFGPTGRAWQFEHWDTPLRRDVYAACQDTGCLWWIDEHGNTLPNGVRSMATYREDLARLRAADHESD